MNIFMGLAIGLLSGFFGGLVGLGGGIIMIPLMVGLLKINQHMAHGTSLVGVVFTGISGAITYSLSGSIELVPALLLASTAMITARLGARYATSLPEWKLKRSFGYFLIFVTIVFLLKPYLGEFSLSSTVWIKTIILLGIGAFAGFLSGMMGVGGGSIMVPAMVIFAGMGQQMAQGISLLAMIPASAIGAFTHNRNGNVHTKILPGLVVGILPGTFLGGSLAHILPEVALRIIFAIVVVYTAIKNIRAKKPETAMEPST
ncbi:sulfite exporter TauE/SafE family protein [Desulfitobacterium hafniense]|uniref:Probable membrane transporter protein n=2 Tax=Desulfitobacterium hafniense TaxID=49338 RepID=Q251F7_DESHY|nr:sulfite exporter TauE/SafE family protein [Desulfitobacterium hafniense]KTE91518.1 permease [Desulfitobacterium hafniense]BAE82085.1 hypothetical protein DSY0296 [Desulfitobacterium hafniense Y51]